MPPLPDPLKLLQTHCFLSGSLNLHDTMRGIRAGAPLNTMVNLWSPKHAEYDAQSLLSLKTAGYFSKYLRKMQNIVEYDKTHTRSSREQCTQNTNVLEFSDENHPSDDGSIIRKLVYGPHAKPRPSKFRLACKRDVIYLRVYP